MTIVDLLAKLDRVKCRGSDRWIAICPAHQDSNPSLSIRDGEKAVLLHCWAGCELKAITSKLGIPVNTLFHDHSADVHQRRQEAARRDKEKAAQRAAYLVKGRRADSLREAEYLVQATRGISIQGWSDAHLNMRLNALADAYEILERESHDA